MNFYDVLVHTTTKTKALFTYAANQNIPSGTVVSVPFRTKTFYGVVVRNATAYPKAKTVEAVHQAVIPAPLLMASLKLAEHSGIAHSGIAQLLLGGFNPARSNELVGSSLSIASGSSTLTKDQAKVVAQIQESKPGVPILLHGITGSGKTRVYIELIKEQLKVGKSCIVLSPEVGLGSQLAKDVEDQYGSLVVFTHSNQTKKERELAWAQSSSHKAKILIGPRSSLFLPVPNLGLIVLDEFHDDSYKQDNDPRYHALHAASMIARAGAATLVCGSATPNVTDYYLFKKGGYPILELTEKAKESARPALVSIIDTKKSYSSKLLSEAAEKNIEAALSTGNQALVFFNRRGSSRLVVCEECGYSELCPTCDYQMTLHRDKNILTCHSCGHTKKPSSSCVECKSPLSYMSPGIKQLELEIRKRFDDAKIVRFDSDTDKKTSLSSQVTGLKTSKSTIIIGTQIVTKGLDLPLLETVVVVRAESALAIPDYRAEEKLYQQISQLIGRVGRGHVSHTTVLLQTIGKHTESLTLAAAEDWQSFYNKELGARKTTQLPPYRYMASIRVRRKTEKGVESAAEKLADKISAGLPKVQLIGPAPALIEKKPAYYEWTIQALSHRRSELLKIDSYISANEFLDLDPTQIF